jgi:radical SAM superfamily enzyme YgiQ (UPF0313 family)
MKILLINPAISNVYGGLPPSVQIPLGLAYIAAVIEKEGYPVEIVDVEAEGITPQKLLEKIFDFKPSIVGFTCTTPTFKSAIETATLIKKKFPGIKTIFGGIHPTVALYETIQSEIVDFVVKGEGEITAVELLSAIKGTIPFSKVKGISYKYNGNIVINSDRDLIENLDELPFPARHLFMKQSYTYPDSLSKNTFPMITSRGCPGRCTFCNTCNIFGHHFRARSSKNVVDEIEFLINTFNAREIHIWDDNFVTIKKRIFEIRDLLKKRNIKVRFAFPNGLRADFLSYEILTVLKDMGTYSIAIGVESGNQGVLDRAKKGIKLDKIRDSFRYAKEIGLETWAFFMFGLPGETCKSVSESIKFAAELDPDVAKFHILKPYPGTEVYEELKGHGLITSFDYSNFGIHAPPVHKLPGLDDKYLLEMQKYAYRKFYLRPKKIIQQVTRLKSFYRIKLNILVAVALLKKMFIRNHRE